jgi:hypothetical protein
LRKETEIVNETVKLPSGGTVTIPKLMPEEAERRCYLTREMLDLMHLAPVGQPVACSGEGEDLVFYYDPFTGEPVKKGK